MPDLKDVMEMLECDSNKRQCSPVGGILQQVLALGNFQVLEEAKSCTGLQHILKAPHENRCIYTSTRINLLLLTFMPDIKFAWHSFTRHRVHKVLSSILI